MKLFKFYAQWCAPCKAMTPILKEIAEQANVEIVEIDVEENAEIRKNYNITGVPTLVMVDEAGNEIRRLVGNQKKSELKFFVTGQEE